VQRVTFIRPSSGAQASGEAPITTACTAIPYLDQAGEQLCRRERHPAVAALRRGPELCKQSRLGLGRPSAHLGPRQRPAPLPEHRAGLKQRGADHAGQHRASAIASAIAAAHGHRRRRCRRRGRHPLPAELRDLQAAVGAQAFPAVQPRALQGGACLEAAGLAPDTRAQPSATATASKEHVARQVEGVGLLAEFKQGGGGTRWVCGKRGAGRLEPRHHLVP